ncbi:MAG: asparaginase [Myxococcaceae bacterium]|jgi:L-asparaginase II|nr:asparaginase [Myxococcaceae bacterium]MCA3014306.1 asparaginase [Myxococcaceae bacterium]
MFAVVQTRGAIVEATHPFSVASAWPDGRVTVEGRDVTTAFRSAAKPFQLAVSLEALGDPPVSEAMLAVGAASHSAEPAHLEVVRLVLAQFGLSEGALRCGAHAPMHEPSAHAVLRAGGAFTDLHNNCSGKHAFMAAAARRGGLDADYRPADHPLQRANRAALEQAAGGAAQVATDGCGVPTFGFPLSGIARAWGHVAASMAAVEAAAATDATTARLGRIAWAMAKHPQLTSGTGRLDLDVVRASPEPITVKVGAMGLFCIALPRRRLALAVKVASGVAEALPAAVRWALERVGVSLRLPSPWPLCEVRSVAGLVAGEVAVRPLQP